MAWIESHQELARHPKVRRLARILGCRISQVIGHLHLLWWWAMDYAQDGDLTGYEAADIAEVCDWPDDPQRFIDALLSCGVDGRAGFLERKGDRLIIHDWWQYAGRLIELRRKDAERKRQSRQQRSDGKEPSAGHPQDGGRTADVTQPNQTKQDHPSPLTPLPNTKRTRRRTSKDVPLEVLHGMTGDAATSGDEQVRRWVEWYFQRHPRPDASKTELTEITEKARSEFSALKAAGATDKQMRRAIDEAPPAAMPWDVTKTYRMLFAQVRDKKAKVSPRLPSVDEVRHLV